MEKTQSSTSVNNYTFNSEKFEEEGENITRQSTVKLKGALNNKNKIRSSKKYKGNIPKNLLPDLENTFDLNIEILKTFYKSSNLRQDEEIYKRIELIKNIFNKKEELVKQIKEVKSKILIELQIYGEKKRKVEEMKEFYADQTGDNENNLLGKEENISKIRKKLKEVEIYIHKLGRNLKDKEREKGYLNFYINDFLDTNNELNRKKYILNLNIDKIKKDLENTRIENNQYKNEGAPIPNGYEGENDKNEDLVENNNVNNDEELKKKLQEKYKKKNKILYDKIDLIQKKYNLLSDILYSFKLNMNNINDFDKNNKNSQQQNNINVNNNNLYINCPNKINNEKEDEKEIINKKDIKENDNINIKINKENKINNNNKENKIYNNDSNNPKPKPVMFKKVSVAKNLKTTRDSKRNERMSIEENKNTNKETYRRPNNNYMDISILNNRADDTKFGDGGDNNFGMVSKSNIWDISAINDKDF